MLEEGKERGVLQACWHVEEKGHGGPWEGRQEGKKEGEEERRAGQERVEEWRDAWTASWDGEGGRRV